MHHLPSLAPAGADDTITGPEHGADGLAARPAWPPRAQRHVIGDTGDRNHLLGGISAGWHFCWVAFLLGGIVE